MTNTQKNAIEYLADIKSGKRESVSNTFYELLKLASKGHPIIWDNHVEDDLAFTDPPHRYSLAIPLENNPIQSTIEELNKEIEKLKKENLTLLDVISYLAELAYDAKQKVNEKKS